MIQTGRNSFARQTVRRHIAAGTKCWWCGQVPYLRMVPRAGAWQYYVEPDAGRSYDIKGQFCCIDCLNSYHS